MRSMLQKGAVRLAVVSLSVGDWDQSVDELILASVLIASEILTRNQIYPTEVHS